jgi:hypothetical protein
MNKDRDTGRELSGSTMLRYALVGIGLLSVAVIARQGHDLISEVRSPSAAVTVGAGGDSLPVLKRKRPDYRSWGA